MFEEILSNPQITWSERQRQTADVLWKIVQAPEVAGRTILVSGFSGTGKTTLVKALKPWFESHGVLFSNDLPSSDERAKILAENPQAKAIIWTTQATLNNKETEEYVMIRHKGFTPHELVRIMHKYFLKKGLFDRYEVDGNVFEKALGNYSDYTPREQLFHDINMPDVLNSMGSMTLMGEYLDHLPNPSQYEIEDLLQESDKPKKFISERNDFRNRILVDFLLKYFSGLADLLDKPLNISDKTGILNKSLTTYVPALTLLSEDFISELQKEHERQKKLRISRHERAVKDTKLMTDTLIHAGDPLGISFRFVADNSVKLYRELYEGVKNAPVGPYGARISIFVPEIPEQLVHGLAQACAIPLPGESFDTERFGDRIAIAEQVSVSISKYKWNSSREKALQIKINQINMVGEGPWAKHSLWIGIPTVGDKYLVANVI
ncbi:MAG: hypothetical protein AAB874_06960, partial [Patescibacteria group bacterium]